MKMGQSLIYEIKRTYIFDKIDGMTFYPHE